MPKAFICHTGRKVKAVVHNPQGKAPTDRQRTRAMHTGSKAWRALRASILARDSYQCAKCGQFGDQVDHKDGDSHNNDPRNLQVLCLKDHSAKTMRELNEARR